MSASNVLLANRLLQLLVFLNATIVTLGSINLDVAQQHVSRVCQVLRQRWKDKSSVRNVVRENSGPVNILTAMQPTQVIASIVQLVVIRIN
jgi:hypothetical protein